MGSAYARARRHPGFALAFQNVEGHRPDPHNRVAERRSGFVQQTADAGVLADLAVAAVNILPDVDQCASDKERRTELKEWDE